MTDEHSQRKRRFMDLFRPLHARLDRFALAMTGNNEDARDLVHDTVLVAFEGFDNLKDQKAFLSFLFTVASRIYYKRRRRTKWFGEYDQERVESITDGRTTPDTAADVALLYDALARLPEAQREAVTLFEISGLSLEEIREVQGGTLSGVKARVVRGRRRLAEILNADEHPTPESRSRQQTQRNGQSTSDTGQIIFSNTQINEYGGSI